MSDFELEIYDRIKKLPYDQRVKLLKHITEEQICNFGFTDLVSLSEIIRDEIKIRMNFQVSNPNGIDLYDCTTYDTEEIKRRMQFIICDNLLIGINGKNELLIGSIDNEDQILLIKSFHNDEKSFLAFNGIVNKDNMNVRGSWSIFSDYTAFNSLFDRLSNSIDYSLVELSPVDLERINQVYKDSNNSIKEIVINLFYKSKSLSLKKRDENNG